VAVAAPNALGIVRASRNADPERPWRDGRQRRVCGFEPFSDPEE
jgi:hypothetical protein